MKYCFLSLCLFLSFSAYPQVAANTESVSPFPLYKVKVSIFDQSYFSLPTFKVHGDFLLGGAVNPVYISGTLGYTFNSQDELCKAQGYFLGLDFNIGTPSYTRSVNSITYGFFYNRTFINDYLKVTKSASGLGNYYEYEKMDYRKERFGFVLSYQRQFPIYGPLFFELGTGVGVMNMRTIVPDGVSQLTFTNGVYRTKNVLTPSLNFNMKLGFSLM